MSKPSADVVVIGGGVIGSATAFCLARAGASVVLLDASTPGRATSASAGGLWPLGEALGLGCGVIYHASHGGAKGGPEPLPRLFMRFLMESNRRFPALAEELRETGGVDIEAESGTGLLYLLYDEEQERHARRILEWLDDGDHEDRAGVEEWTAAEVFEHEPRVTRDLRGAIHFPGDNQVNPMLLGEAFKRAATARGARLVSEARVTGLTLRDGAVVEVQSSAGNFACATVVNAAGAWSAAIARFAGLDVPVFPVRGQIVCTETLARTLHANLSTRDCYLLQKAHGEVIVGSTTERSEFDVSVKPTSLAGLARGAVRAVPALRHATVKRTWAGLRPGTPDELPVLGPAAEIANFHYATGGFRTGIVAAPLSAEIVAALVLGEAPPFPVEAFLASRFAGALAAR